MLGGSPAEVGYPDVLVEYEHRKKSRLFTGLHSLILYLQTQATPPRKHWRPDSSVRCSNDLVSVSFTTPARPSRICRRRYHGSAYNWRTACTGHTQAALLLLSTTPPIPRKSWWIPHPPGAPTMAGRSPTPTPTSVPYRVSQSLALWAQGLRHTLPSPSMVTGLFLF